MKKVTKKIVATALSVVMVAGAFAGCSAAKNDATDVEKKTEYNIGICQLVQHEALDAATQGFKDKLTALGEAEGITFNFDEQNASGEQTNCTTITSKFVSDNVDLIMANATPALLAASQATDTIPVLGTSITEYGVALEIENFDGKTGFNVSGTSDLAPLVEQAAMVKEIVPEASKVALLYCSAEANSKYQVDVVSAELEKLGVETKTYTFVDTNDVVSVTNQVVADACDAVYIPTDNTAAANAEAINNVLEPANIPVIAGEEGICRGCGVATLSISYYNIGEKTAEMAYDILVNGADVATMEIQYDASPVKKYAADRAGKLGVTIPEGYEAIA